MNVFDAILARAGRCVLVSVARAQGSTPRDAGTKMAVFADAVCGTIGGGNLEFKAIERARQMIAEDSVAPTALVRFPLGPSLGQCCGGAATLVFARIDEPRPAWLGVLAERGGMLISRAGGIALEGDAGATRLEESADAWAFHDRIEPDDFHVAIFGAGHVGTALATVLGAVDCRVTWIDDRPGQFPERVAPNVRTVFSTRPALEADAIAAGSYCLVMTHTHALDEEVCERLLRRGDYAYLGLIGSATKRAQFERRLAARGISREALALLVCPIGIDGIHTKAPGGIAVGVAAQLLALHETRRAGDTRASSPTGVTS